MMDLLLKQLEGLLDSETDMIANAANMASLLFNHLDNVNWVGFYFFKEDELVLGPFCGQPACTRIPIAKGVCGTAFANRKTLVVDDVHQFEGHIACDVASQSEIVVPFFMANLKGVLDVDSPIVNRFSQTDQLFFEQAVKLYTKACLD